MSAKDQDNSLDSGEAAADSLSLPLVSLWSDFTSQVGNAFATSDTTYPGVQDTSTQIASTSQASSTVSSVAADRTSYATVGSTTAPGVQSSPSVGASVSLPLETTASPTPEACTTIPLLETTSLASQSTSQISILAATTKAPNPDSATFTIPLESHQPLDNPSNFVANRKELTHNAHKKAMIGGLSGAIVGLLLIGAIIFLFLKRRRRFEAQPSDHLSEKGFPGYYFQRANTPVQWNDSAARPKSGSPAPHPPARTGSTSASVDEDHHIIRMNTRHWPRPFIHGQCEGIRDSIAPGLLRITNPDPTRPNTPDFFTASDPAGPYATKTHKPTLATVILHRSRSRASTSTSMTERQSRKVPNIVIDPALSEECITRRTLSITSLRSYISGSTNPIVQQRPPEDPFVTPPIERAPPARRPALAPLQSAARTLEIVGSSFLHPFRSRTNAVSSVRAVAPSETASSTRSSFVSTTAGSRRSDPFDLDRPSVRNSVVGGAENGRSGRDDNQWPLPSRHLSLYEGT